MDAFFRNTWFCALPEHARRSLLGESYRVFLQRGEMLLRRGDPVQGARNGFYGVVSGVLKASTLREDGREAILVPIEAGNWIGETSLLDGGTRTHDITACEYTELLVLPAERFHALMCHADFAAAIACLLARRIRLAYSVVDSMTGGDVRARVVHRLSLLAHGAACARPAVDAYYGLRLPVSQDTLAMMVGLSRQTVNKELRALVDEGIISLRYGQIRIHAPERLHAIEPLGGAWEKLPELPHWRQLSAA